MAKKKVNKMEAVRQVIAKHGKETMPVEIVKFVKDEHGVEMTASVASNYKSSALKQLGMAAGGKAKPGRKPGRKPVAASANGAMASPKPSSGGGISLADIEAVKELAAKLGADKVRQLAEILA